MNILICRFYIFKTLCCSKTISKSNHSRQCAGPDGSFVTTGAGRDICHRAYTVLQTVQRHGVYSAAHDTMKNPWCHSK